MQKAFHIFGGFYVQNGIKDIQTSIDHLRNIEGVTDKVGAVGFGLGGMMAYLSYCATDVNASIGFYGVNINNLLNHSSNIKTPLLLHIATEDEFADKDAQKQIHDGLVDNDIIDLQVYQGKDHTFARVGGDHYDRDAASRANNRTLDFFKKHLF
jgi:carboxymethylenebutenolidase